MNTVGLSWSRVWVSSIIRVRVGTIFGEIARCEEGEETAKGGRTCGNDGNGWLSDGRHKADVVCAVRGG